jgi:hypothetical protein
VGVGADPGTGLAGKLSVLVGMVVVEVGACKVCEDVVVLEDDDIAAPVCCDDPEERLA